MLIVGVLAACGGSKQDAAPRSTADFGTLIGAGTHLLGAGNVAAAEQLFQQAITKSPDNPTGYYDLGVAYQQEGRARLAMREYRRATRWDPEYTPALYNQAVLLTGRDNPTAVFLYHKVIAIRPDSPTALLNLGLIEASLKGDAPAAYKHLTRAIRLDAALRKAVPAALLARLRQEASRQRVPKGPRARL